MELLFNNTPAWSSCKSYSHKGPVFVGKTRKWLLYHSITNWIMFNRKHVIFSSLTYSAMAPGIQDLNNFDSDPEEFARTFCKDLGVDDPEVGVRKPSYSSTDISFLIPINNCRTGFWVLRVFVFLLWVLCFLIVVVLERFENYEIWHLKHLKL